jgi:hypothetical protein
VERLNEKQLFTLLPPAKPRWKSFLIGWSPQILALVCLVLMGARVRQVVISVEDYRVTKLMSYEPSVLQKQRRVPLPVLQSKLSQDSKPLLKNQAPVTRQFGIRINGDYLHTLFCDSSRCSALAKQASVDS